MSTPASHFWAGNQLRRYRRQRHLRLVDVARRMGLRSAVNVSNWERGRRQPSLANALKLSAAIGCPIEVLYCDHFKQIRSKMFHRRE